MGVARWLPLLLCLAGASSPNGAAVRFMLDPANDQPRGWLTSGPAFRAPPGSAAPGVRWTSSPTEIGELHTPPFTVPNGTLTVEIRGGGSADTWVELRARPAGRAGPYLTVSRATPPPAGQPRQDIWDLSHWVGWTAVLAVVDRSDTPDGWIELSGLRFSDLGQVPRLRGLSLDQAHQRLRQAGLLTGSIEWYADTGPDGRVIESDPPAGRVLAGGGRVDLKLGIRLETIPPLTGLTLSQAERALTAVGRRIGQVIQTPTLGPPDRVTDQWPAPGSRAPIDQPVDLWTSTGRAQVPDVQGMTMAEARQALSEAGLTIEPASPPVPAGSNRVYRQSPAPGATVAWGSPVRLSRSPAHSQPGPDISLEVDPWPPVAGQPALVRVMGGPAGLLPARFRFDFDDRSPILWHTDSAVPHTWSEPGTRRIRAVMQTGPAFSESPPLDVPVQPPPRLTVSLANLHFEPGAMVEVYARLEPAWQDHQIVILPGDGREFVVIGSDPVRFRYDTAGRYPVRATASQFGQPLAVSQPVPVTVAHPSPLGRQMMALVALVALMTAWLWGWARRRRPRPPQSPSGSGSA